MLIFQIPRRIATHAHVVLAIALGMLAPSVCQGSSDHPSLDARIVMPDEWTAQVLPSGAWAVGSLLEVGTPYGLMIGSDPAALALGAKTLQVKWQVPGLSDDQWALSLKYLGIARKSLWWGGLSRQFSELDAQVIRPAVSWSNRISPRLMLHSFWASGLGRSHAVLSEQGLADLRKAKQAAEPPSKDHNFARRTMQLQSIAGFTEDRFQVTADWDRDASDRVLLTTRFERTKLEALESFSVRITLAQQWSSDGFSFRLGGGPQYSILSGKDLDGEEINAAGWTPAADLAIFWLL